jgi:hypothetical protein
MAELNPEFMGAKDRKELLERVEVPKWTYAIVNKDMDGDTPISSMKFDIPFEYQDRPMSDLEGILFNPKKGEIAMVMKRVTNFKDTEKKDQSFKKPE